MEARTLLRVLANQNVPRGRADGEFEINGNSLRPKAFAERVSYVSNDDLYPRLTVKQHLHLMSSFVKPATDAFKTKNMVSFLGHRATARHVRVQRDLGRLMGIRSFLSLI